MIKVGVIGIGKMGGFHSSKVANSQKTELSGIFDLDFTHATTKAKEFDTTAFKSIDELLLEIDAVILASPTSTHAEIGKKVLQAGKHLLVEKPIASSIDEAQQLVEIAKEKGLVLSVGHIENFNPAFLAAFEHIENPLFVEAHRLSPFVGRGADVSVVMDLMIHDIEILMRLMGDVREIRASGGKVLTGKIDIASARLQFENGVANVTASRISYQAMRKMRFFTDGGYVSLDFGGKKVEAVFRGKKPGLSFEMGGETFTKAPVSVTDLDPLNEELNDFVSAISNNTEPMVTGKRGLEALKIANQIIEIIG